MYQFVVNPASRSGRGKRLWDEVVEPALQAEHAAYRVRFSGAAGEISRIVGEITESAGPGEAVTLVILGGDGTVDEALQGLADPAAVTLGYIPTGSSNDLARDLGIPKDPREALGRVLHGEARPMDMGVARFPDGREHRFAVSCGMGFDAAVCESVLSSRAKGFLNRLGMGKLTYLAVALRELLTANMPSCQVIVAGQPPLMMNHFLFAAGMVHRYEGGGFRFCPEADDRDGLLDVCAVGDLPRLAVLLALPTAFFGKHFLFPGVHFRRGEAVTITASHPLCVHADGEVLGPFDTLTLECRREALKILL